MRQRRTYGNSGIPADVHAKALRQLSRTSTAATTRRYVIREAVTAGDTALGDCGVEPLLNRTAARGRVP
jgi:hypothetical protein